MLGAPAIVAGEWIALPFAIGCGFAGGGLPEICPKEAIWHFSPLFFTDLHRNVWRLVRRFQIDWVVILLAAPVALEILRQALGARFNDSDVARIFYLEAPAFWLYALVILARQGAEGRRATLPYVPALAAGAVIGLFFGEALLDAWLG